MSAKRLTIALVSDAVLPFHKGGKETRIYHLAQELVRMGQNVEIYTMKWWNGNSNTHIQDGLTFHALCRLYPLYSGKRRSIREGVLFGFACLKMVNKNFDVMEIDHMPYFPLFAAKLVSIIRRKPLYATWHEVVGLASWKSYIGTVGGTLAYAIERLCVRLPDHIVAVSEHTQQQLRDTLHYKGPLSLVNNGIDYNHISSVAPAETHCDLLYAGRLTPHKNVDLLVQAVAVLKRKQPNIRCIIVGTGSEYDKLLRMIKECELEKNITLTGRLESSDDVFALMKSSKVFVSPSFREGFGITILEAYACGLSVITVKHHNNAAQHLVKDGTGIICEPTPVAIAQAASKLLGTLGVKTQQEAAKYAWTKQALALRKVYGI